jgi:multicomponent Na+:H+ antiporter subunit F
VIVAMPVAVFLLANLVAALTLVARGPTPADRVLSVQLFGTTGVAVLVLLDATSPVPLLDVAVAFAVLAGVTGSAFAARGWPTGEVP